MILLVIIAFAAFAATFVGGSFALHFRDKLHLILGFSAGAVAGVAFFDLVPEAMRLTARHNELALVAPMLAAGFFGYLLLDRLILLHTHAEEDAETGQARGALGALTLSAHSFIDGIAIGASFQVSVALGIVVTLAVLTHDFSDGINTVTLVLTGGGSRRSARYWLIADALAPVAGVAATLLVKIPEGTLALALALFAGSFLYLSASDLIPESHHRHPRALTTVTTIAGALLLWLIVWIAG